MMQDGCQAACFYEFFAIPPRWTVDADFVDLIHTASFSPARRTLSIMSMPLVTLIFGALHASLLSHIFARSSSTVL
jgi:hypothetical protein